MRTLIALLMAVTMALLRPNLVAAQRLFVGLEEATLTTQSTDLAGFPTVIWTSHFPFEVNGAACAPDGTLYLCNGPFTTRLYRSTLTGPPQFVTNVSVDVHGMGYGRGQLYGYANFASPLGIYAIDPQTGMATLAIDTSAQGFRFFGLDYNPIDDRLYGYTEYGVSGLYTIDIDSGMMTRLVGSPPNVNGQGRALAVGNNTVYLLATRGDEGEPCFAYDLSQGPGGAWTPFTNPYPAHHSTGGAAWIPGSTSAVGAAATEAVGLRLVLGGSEPTGSATELHFQLPAAGPIQLDIFNVLGRRLATPIRGPVEAGPHIIRWDGRSDAGSRVPSGIYMARLVQGREQATARILIVR